MKTAVFQEKYHRSIRWCSHALPSFLHNGCSLTAFTENTISENSKGPCPASYPHTHCRWLLNTPPNAQHIHTAVLSLRHTDQPSEHAGLVLPLGESRWYFMGERNQRSPFSLQTPHFPQLLPPSMCLVPCGTAAAVPEAMPWADMALEAARGRRVEEGLLHHRWREQHSRRDKAGFEMPSFSGISKKRRLLRTSCLLPFQCHMLNNI